MSVNLLRGRDRFEDNITECQSHLGGTKHRGELFTSYHYSFYMSKKKEYPWHKLDDDYLNSIWCPAFNSYKSTNGGATLVYDSAVYIPPSYAAAGVFFASMGATFKTTTAGGDGSYEEKLLNTGIKSSIVATLAVRTRRINAFASN